ncbi:MAG TPA: CPBP family intramembrane glutamic endopeptidase [Acidimicrobiia bacterium]|nr:CPBP family intramembrane glutamic endopeptidase [Acidimicrobiia bacterium]
MGVVAGALSVALLTYLVFFAPSRGRARYERMRAAVAEDPRARSRFYVRGMVTKWIMTAIVLALFIASGRQHGGIPFLRTDSTARTTALMMIAAVLAGAIVLHRLAASDKGRAKIARGLRNVDALLPRTASERKSWVFASITAGVTEEVIYRAFPMILLTHVFSIHTTWAFLVIPAAIFGLAHLYQGWKGVALTGLVGLVLGSAVLTAGLVTAIVVHALIDLRLLVVRADLLEQALATEPAPTANISRRRIAAAVLCLVLAATALTIHVPNAEASYRNANEIAAVLQRAHLGCADAVAQDTTVALTPQPISRASCVFGASSITIDIYRTHHDLVTATPTPDFPCVFGSVVGTNWTITSNDPTGATWTSHAPGIASATHGRVMTGKCL